MKILVAAARVTDPAVLLRLKSDGSGLDLTNAKWSLNPFDEVAAEQAVLMQQGGTVTETIAISIGPIAAVKDVLRKTLAMGIGRAIHIPYDGYLDARAVAHGLRLVVTREKPDLVLLGKQTSDNGSGQVGGYLAGLLGVPQASSASKINLSNKHVEVTSEVDGGTETRRLSTPAIVTVDLHLNEPRYASLPAIMKAGKMPIETLAEEDLGVDFASLAGQIAVRDYIEPPVRLMGVKVDNGTQLASILAKAAGLTL